MAVARHSWDFFKGVSPALAFALAAVSDPLTIAHDLGFMTDTVWTIEPWARQSIFAACAFGWLWLWYLGVRRKHEESRPATGDMPIHVAARYLAWNSKWAARLPPSADTDWVMKVSTELMTALGCGRIHAWGRLRQRGHHAQLHTIPIPPDDLREPDWEDFPNLAALKPANKFKLKDGRSYHRIMLNRGEVEREWPKRSLWDRMRGKSPIDRFNKRGTGQTYRDFFAEQDRAYAGAQRLSLDEILE